MIIIIKQKIKHQLINNLLNNLVNLVKMNNKTKIMRVILIAII